MKLTMMLGEYAARKLEESAKRNDTTKSDIVRRAIALFTFVDEKMLHAKDGADRTLVIMKDGKPEREMTLTRF